MLRPNLKNKSKTELTAHVVAVSNIDESKEIIKEPEKIGIKYLEEKVTDIGFQSIIGSDMHLKDCIPSPIEIFTSMLALDLHIKCCKNYSFVTSLIKFLITWHEDGIFYFFQDKKLIPPDVDCTSIGLSILLETNNIDQKTVENVIDKILKNSDKNGVIQVYFDEKRPRIDPIVCINALYLIHLANKHEEKVVKATENFIFDLLVKREYKNHLRYYIAEEQFLYFLSRLVKRFPDRFEKFCPILSREIENKIGGSMNSLNLAMRILASHNVNVKNTSDTKIIRGLQSKHGFWEAHPFFKYGRSEKYFGCRELTTAFAVKAIEQDEEKSAQVIIKEVGRLM